MISALWSLAGLATGATHFALLRWNTRLYLTGGLMQAVGAQLLRLASIALPLCMAAWNGALPLLLAASGVMVARFLVLRVAEVLP
jgi:F1F0 ATPase subunit 2